MTEQPQVPVLIVGGSLVGLSTALFLARQGVPCLVLEQRTSLSSHPRTRGVNPRSMELLRAAGLEDELRALPSARALARNSGLRLATSLAGPELGAFQEEYYREVSSDLSGLSPTTWCLCHQNELEGVLRGAAERAGAVFRFGSELVSCEQDTFGVTAAVRDRDGCTERLRARYLVAADGARSTVRRQLDIPFGGTGQLGRFLAIHFRADLTAELGDRRFIMCYTFNSQVRGALIPLDNAQEWRLDVILDPTATEDVSAAYPPERCAELVRAAAGVPQLPVEILGIAPWEAAAKVAAGFRSGRVFLAGDAAHVMPPSGAFGSNTGVQDAHNLAWKLAAVLTGHASPDLLDSYDAERRPICEATVRQAVLRQQDRPRSGDRNGRRGMPPGVVEDTTLWFGWRYRSDVLADESEPATAAEPEVWATDPRGLPGTRAPHVQLLRDGGECSTLDLFHGAPVLLTGSVPGHWPAAAAAASSQLGVPLDVHGIGGEGEFDDPTGTWAKTYGVTDAGAVLVRPDGVVAWRSAGAPDDTDALRQALARLLAR
ncbi:FAD-dependent monooxygenase [Kitasatospora sp. GP82]|uniref:FAD-dependent monooxygenase n=1 Tax=Kitasatospora sp. GP82 TaxID=3035089 RepID=UPI0024753697|nr:FAD-dependent monooxygenase [Kitasatospora sp. GP82]MDH6129112.1 putative polyketide hydroxylase [Kitasatospora sp. GP82]